MPNLSRFQAGAVFGASGTVSAAALAWLLYGLATSAGWCTQPTSRPTTAPSAWHPPAPSPEVQAREAEAHVAGEGLFAELSMQADGVTVRRVRDVKAGVVCYVATGTLSARPYYGLDGRYPAISCLRER